MNIVLTGMRGSGKSYYGKALARALSWEFVDTDTLIEQKMGLSIKEFVQQHGWPHFRKIENEVCAEVSCLDESIISTGGGMIIHKENEEKLKQNGKVIFLYRTPEKCAESILRGSRRDERPSLLEEKGNKDISTHTALLEELTQVWAEREKRYRQSADLIIDVNEEKNPEEILELLENF